MPTLEAITAGTQAIMAELGTVDMGQAFDPAALAVQVYEVMRALEPKGKVLSTFVLNVDTSGLERVLAGIAAEVAEFKAAVEAAAIEDDEPNRG